MHEMENKKLIIIVAVIAIIAIAGLLILSFNDESRFSIFESRRLFNDDITSQATFREKITTNKTDSRVDYQDGSLDLNISLRLKTGAEYENIEGTIFQSRINNRIKFGYNKTFAVAIRASDTSIPARYIIRSNSPLSLLNDKILSSSRFTQKLCGSVACTNERFEQIDFSDICTRTVNRTTIDQDTGQNGTVLFDPECTFEVSQNISEYRITLDFLTLYDSKLKFITIDPTITITDVSVSASILSNITAENNFTHLTMGDTTIGFVNDTNLVMYIPLDTDTSSTTAYDYTAGDNDGTFTANAAFTSDGIYGGAVTHDGTDDLLRIPRTTAMETQTVTIMAWFRRNGAQDANAPILTKAFANDESNPFNSYGLQVNSNSVGSDTVTFYTGHVTGGPRRRLDSNVTINDGQWYHVAGTYDGTTKVIVVNGDSISTSETGDMNMDSTSGGDVRSGGVSDDFYTGEVDEMMIFNRSLTIAEITSIYTNQSSRFFPRGEQEFQNNNVTNGTFVNITINSSTLFGSSINISIGNLSGSSYDFGDEFAFTNNFASDIPVGTPQNFSLKFIFYTGNESSNSFFSPTLENNIVIESFGEEDGEDTTAPTVTLVAPANDTTITDNTTSFNATATDNINVSIMAFYLWNSTHVLINQTNTSTSGTSVSANLTVTLPIEDTYMWNYLGFDNATTANSAFASSNFTLIFSSTNSCTYTSGTWNVDCADNCSITNDIVIDTGGNISITGAGQFVIQEGVNITGWTKGQTSRTCFVQGFGSGGFFGF